MSPPLCASGGSRRRARRLPDFQRLNRVLDASRREVAQKRIARPQRQKPERRPFARQSLGEKAVDDFVRGSVAADCQKISRSTCIRLARDLGRLARVRCVSRTSTSIPSSRTRSIAAAASRPHFRRPQRDSRSPEIVRSLKFVFPQYGAKTFREAPPPNAPRFSGFAPRARPA